MFPSGTNSRITRRYPLGHVNFSISPGKQPGSFPSVVYMYVRVCICTCWLSGCMGVQMADGRRGEPMIGEKLEVDQSETRRGTVIRLRS